VRVPVEERLFSLVLALVATETGLTKNEILSTVQGYRQRYRPGGDNASLERQFERDKDDIRDLGIPMETVESPGEQGNNQLLRYRISKGDYDLPADITFSAQEITLLGLAATVWRQGSLSAESQRALLKLRSLGIPSDDPVIGYAPRLRTRESSFEPLRNALERHSIVTFTYLKPGDAAPRVRNVSPLALVQHRGRWHLYGIDNDLGARRTFLLARIVGTPRSTSRTFALPEGGGFADRALAELDALWRSQRATVRVVPGSDAETRLSKRPGSSADLGGVLTLHYTDVDILADELASFGPEVEALSPGDLRAAVIKRLMILVNAHGPAAADPAADIDAHGTGE
jgi:proteasome accessory factor B